MKFWQTLLRREEISRYSVQQYVNDLTLAYNGHRYVVTGGSAGYTKTEDIEHSFTGYVSGFYKSNGIVFAITLARLLLFTEARFCWFNVGDNGEDGKPAGRSGLEVLERPWSNAGTGELLARMEQDASLGGNFYAARLSDRLRRLRPDWVTIVLTAPPAEATESDVAGYWYHPGRTYSNAGEPQPGDQVYLPDEICHFSPIPDPDAQYRGMSWLTPVVTEVTGDKAATEHKLNFFRNGATFGQMIAPKENLTPQQFTDWKNNVLEQTQGVFNAYRPLFMASPIDTSISSADMKQLDFKVTQGAGETRLCAAGGVPPIIVGLSEGLQSATYSNYGMARRKFGDHWARPQWKFASTALSNVVDQPDGDLRLGVNVKDIAFLREDRKDQVEITHTQILSIEAGVRAGVNFDALVDAVAADDVSLLRGQHSGLFSVQLQAPGAQDTDGDGVADTTAADETADDEAAAEYEAELQSMRDGVERARYGSGAGERIAIGHEGGGRFRKLSDRITDAIKDFLDGKGDDDPLEPFSREQLRKAAKDLGITPRRGASAEEIKLALLKHRKAHAATPRGKVEKALAEANEPPDYVPRHIKDVLDHLEGKRKPPLPLSVLYATVNQYSYARYFTPEQRRDVLDKSRGILPKTREGQERESLERVIRDLEEIAEIESPAPAKKAARKAPKKATPEAKAVDRQERIDKVRGTAESVAETLELLDNEASEKALKHRINAMHTRGKVDEKTRDRMLKGVDDGNLADTVEAIAAENDLEIAHQPGDVVAWNKSTGLSSPAGHGFRDGTMVRVFRPGVRYDPGDGKVTVAGGLAEEATPDEIAEAKGRKDRFAPPPERDAEMTDGHRAVLKAAGSRGFVSKVANPRTESSKQRNREINELEAEGYLRKDGDRYVLTDAGKRAAGKGPDEGGALRLDARKIAEGLGSDADFNHGNGNYLDDIQTKLDAGATPGSIAKDIEGSARFLEDHIGIQYGAWGGGRFSDPERDAENARLLAEGRVRVQRLRDLAERLRQTRRPRATTPRADVPPAAVEGSLADLPDDQRAVYEAILRRAGDGGTKKSLGSSSAARQRNDHIDELVDAGYLEQDGESFTLTDKGRRHVGGATSFSEQAATEKFEAPADPSESLRDELDLKKVPDLKDMLRELNEQRVLQGLKPLPLSGRKRELVDRLVEHQAGGAGPKVRERVTAADDRPRQVSARVSEHADLAAMSDDELLALFAEESARARPSTRQLHRIYDELGRREERPPDTPEQTRLDDLVRRGRDYRSAYAEVYDLDEEQLIREDLASRVDQIRLPGETRDRAVRRLYDETVQMAYLQAEQATNGHLLSPAGRAAGVSAASLFSGPRARARKYASEELKRWWENHPRQTYTEFRAMMLGRSADQAAAKKISQQGQEQDFGL